MRAAGSRRGFLAIYAMDLYVHRGVVAGERAEQREQVERIYRRRRPRGTEATVLGFLLAFGGGGMLYLTVTDLVPEAQMRHYQQSSALAIALGFLVVLVLTEFL